MLARVRATNLIAIAATFFVWLAAYAGVVIDHGTEFDDESVTLNEIAQSFINHPPLSSVYADFRYLLIVLIPGSIITLTFVFIRTVRIRMAMIALGALGPVVVLVMIGMNIFAVVAYVMGPWWMIQAGLGQLDGETYSEGLFFIGVCFCWADVWLFVIAPMEWRAIELARFERS